MHFLVLHREEKKKYKRCRLLKFLSGVGLVLLTLVFGIESYPLVEHHAVAVEGHASPARRQVAAY